jgi:hypothetical protein
MAVMVHKFNIFKNKFTQIINKSFCGFEPLPRGQYGAKTLLLSSLEGGGRSPEGEKTYTFLFHPLNPPVRGTK